MVTGVVAMTLYNDVNSVDWAFENSMYIQSLQFA